MWLSEPNHHQSNQRFLGITQAIKDFDVELTFVSSPSLDFLSSEHVAPQMIAVGPLAARDTEPASVLKGERKEPWCNNSIVYIESLMDRGVSRGHFMVAFHKSI